MKELRTEVMKLADIEKNLFVRQNLNEDRVLVLMGMYEGGEKIPPMEVTEKREMVDGRHRWEMYSLCNVAEVEVKVLRFENEVEMIAYAFRANTQGALPPTQADIEHTISLLLNRGQSMKAVSEALGLPLKMTRGFIETIKSKMKRVALQKAANAVIDGGLKAAEAAEQYTVDLDDLKVLLSGNRKKHKNGIEQTQKNVTFLYKSVGSKNAALLKRLLVQYDDGDVTAKQVREVITHVKDAHKKSGRSIHDWEKRFNAKVVEKSPEPNKSAKSAAA